MSNKNLVGSDPTVDNNAAIPSSTNTLPMASLMTNLNQSFDQIVLSSATNSTTTTIDARDGNQTNATTDRVDYDENDGTSTGDSRSHLVHHSMPFVPQQQYHPSNRQVPKKGERNISTIPEDPILLNNNNNMMMNDDKNAVDDDDDDDDEYHHRSSNSPQQSSIITTSSTSATTNYSGSTITNTPGRNDSTTSTTVVLPHGHSYEQQQQQQQQQHISLLLPASAPSLPNIPRTYTPPSSSISMPKQHIQQNHSYEPLSSNPGHNATTSTVNVPSSTTAIATSTSMIQQHPSSTNVTTASHHGTWTTQQQQQPTQTSESPFRLPMKVIQQDQQRHVATASENRVHTTTIHENAGVPILQERTDGKIMSTSSIYDTQQQHPSSTHDELITTSTVDANAATGIRQGALPTNVNSWMERQHQEQGQLQASQTRSQQQQQQSQDGSASVTSSSNSTIVAIKMLISNNIAGSIIGRMGQSISELQVESQTRIKISQSSDYYPGTQDRVCLIQGSSIQTVKNAIRLIIQRCYQIQQSEHVQQLQQQHEGVVGYGIVNPSAILAHQYATNTSTVDSTTTNNPATIAGGGFDFILRLLVPVTCCGMIIGKSGANIKYMEETSGVLSVRLSSKDDSAGYNTGTSYVMIPTNERIITITCSTVEQCVQCIYIVLDGMMNHPDISTYTNMTTSYVQHNTMNHHHRQNQHPIIYTHMSNPMLMSQQHQQIQQRRVYHHPSPPDQQQVYWTVDGSVMYNAANQAMQIVPSQHPTIVEGLNRRIASSPNLPINRHEGTRIGQAASVGRGGSFHQQHGPSSPANAGHSNVMQQRSFVLQNTNTQGASLSVAPITATNTQAASMINQEHYSSYHQNPSTYRPVGTLQSAQSDSAAVSHSTSEPNLAAMQLEQSLIVAQVQDGRTNQSISVPSVTLVSNTLLHPSAFQQPIDQSEYHMVVNDSSLGANTTAAALALQVPTMIVPGCFTAQVLVPDTMIGSILGRGGRTLTELQMMSGTNIRISQRNEYMPGTRSRIVTIRGPNTQTVWQAQYMISQRMTSVLTAPGPGQNVGYSAPATSTSTNVLEQPVVVSSSTNSASTPSPAANTSLT